ncbi:hypothetical protein V2I22_02440 [Campylobacter sp. CLAX-7218-21]|uniref:hypothetical protein n=1 Tax=Campylobacter devanensis TaxID=3161138 RepID=UPI002EC2E5CB|nr:hypothetical protein [Campylobacter sp. CLAX-7218-21]
MGFWSSVGSFIGGCCSAIGSICSGIGGAVMGAIGALATTIAPFLGPVATIVSVIANILGIFKENERPEDLGQAMEQMDKKPEDFDSINEYIDYLREGIRSGEVKLNDNLSDIQKAAYTATGAALGIKAIDEKYQLQTSAEFWGAMGKKFEEGKITPIEITKILETSSKNSVSAENVTNYINGDKMTDGQKASGVSDAIEGGLKAANPSMSDEEITSRFNKLIE